MGSDNLHRVRKEQELARQDVKRKPNGCILIVCEGEKTEPNYFNAIGKLLGRYPSARVKAMQSEDGTSPQQVVDSAYKHCKKDKYWDTVFCVFDRDDHQSFENAIKRANARNKKLTNDLGEKIEFIPIVSNPCFELWYFLHFRAHSAEIERSDLTAKLKKIMPGGYEKNDPCHFEKTREHLDKAYKNASKIKGNRDGSRVTNPYTDVDIVVKKLMELATDRKEFLELKRH